MHTAVGCVSLSPRLAVTVARYSSLLDGIFASPTEFGILEGVRVFVRHVVNENVSLVISRQLLSELSSHMLRLPDSTAEQVALFVLETVQPRAISFEEQVGPAAGPIHTGAG